MEQNGAQRQYQVDHLCMFFFFAIHSTFAQSGALEYYDYEWFDLPALDLDENQVLNGRITNHCVPFYVESLNQLV